MAVPVCDLCGYRFQENEEVWVHVTVNTGTMQEAKEGKAFWCEDPEWGVCYTCQMEIEDVAAGRAVQDQVILAMMFRTIRNNDLPVRSRSELGQYANQIIPIVGGFFENKTPGYWKETASAASGS